MSVNTYTRKDGVTGVGFEIDHADRPQISIAWADRPAERFSPDELERKEIRLSERSESNTEPLEFERPDGVRGAGFEIEYAGRRQFNVAWPDGPATRFTTGEMGRQKIHIVGKRPAETNSNGKPSETATKTTVDKLYETVVPVTLTEQQASETLAKLDPERNRTKPAEPEATQTETVDDLPLTIFSEEGKPEGHEDPTLDERAIELLAAGGVKTLNEAFAYLEEHGSFVPIKGIGKATDADIRACLDSVV